MVTYSDLFLLGQVRDGSPITARVAKDDIDFFVIL